jgi:hypothetical protein
MLDYQSILRAFGSLPSQLPEEETSRKNKLVSSTKYWHEKNVPFSLSKKYTPRGFNQRIKKYHTLIT